MAQLAQSQAMPNSAPRHAAVDPGVSLAEQVLAEAQAGRDVVQDFVPLADSLKWELGQEYLRQRGNKAFMSDASPDPFVVNNDGTLSRAVERSDTSGVISHEGISSPAGVAATAISTSAATPPGSEDIPEPLSGGIAALNRRLIAATPTGGGKGAPGLPSKGGRGEGSASRAKC